MKIALHGKEFRDEVLPFVREILLELDRRNIEWVASEDFAQVLVKVRLVLPSGVSTFARNDFPADAYMAFSIGGDGTFLDTVWMVGALEVPILGINAGRLGFLANIPCQGATYALGILFQGDYSIQNRSLIHLDAEVPLFEGRPFALNEFAITKRETSQMVLVNTWLDGEPFNSYWADGVIVSTPTGSTGYSLSVGGPLIVPDTPAFVISPVSAHNLNVRPVVIPDTSVVTFEVEARNNNYLISLDSRSVPLENGQKLSVSKEKFACRMVVLRETHFVQTLRNKLGWGYDVRN